MKELIPWRKKKNTKELSRSKADSLDILHRRVNNIFDNFFEEFEDIFPTDMLVSRGEDFVDEVPNFEVSETDDEFRIRAELPDMDEKDIEVNIQNDILTIRGEKKREHEDKHRNYHFSELSYGSFSRSVQLPGGVVVDKAKAKFKRGVLTLTLPKTEQAKAERKHIAIEAE